MCSLIIIYHQQFYSIAEMLKSAEPPKGHGEGEKMRWRKTYLSMFLRSLFPRESLHSLAKTFVFRQEPLRLLAKSLKGFVSERKGERKVSRDNAKRLQEHAKTLTFWFITKNTFYNQAFFPSEGSVTFTSSTISIPVWQKGRNSATTSCQTAKLQSKFLNT